MKQTGQASLEYLVTICAVLVTASNVFLPVYEHTINKVFEAPNKMMGVKNGRA